MKIKKRNKSNSLEGLKPADSIRPPIKNGRLVLGIYIGRFIQTKSVVLCFCLIFWMNTGKTADRPGKLFATFSWENFRFPYGRLHKCHPLREHPNRRKIRIPPLRLMWHSRHRRRQQNRPNINRKTGRSPFFGVIWAVTE